MSSGEAKRILIARALVHDPQTLVFDEPSTASTFRAARASRNDARAGPIGIGIVLVTHHLSDVIPEIDRVVLMRSGRIQADGRKEDCSSLNKSHDSLDSRGHHAKRRVLPSLVKFVRWWVSSSDYFPIREYSLRLRLAAATVCNDNNLTIL